MIGKGLLKANKLHDGRIKELTVAARQLSPRLCAGHRVSIGHTQVQEELVSCNSLRPDPHLL
jgi:hypothetical protein